MVSQNKRASEMRRVIDWIEPHVDYVGHFSVSFSQLDSMPRVAFGCLQDMVKVANGSQVVVQGPDEFGLYTFKAYRDQIELYMTTTSYGSPLKPGTYTLCQEMIKAELVG